VTGERCRSRTAYLFTDLGLIREGKKVGHNAGMFLIGWCSLQRQIRVRIRRRGKQQRERGKVYIL
jgi:hypothetical protein